MRALTTLLLLFPLVAPSIVSAALFPKDSKVKWINHKQFNKIMKRHHSAAVAFVAPWCGHCQNMAPEWSSAADSLHPLVPLYAVDCDAEHNKGLCAQEGVKGYPTIKMYPRGGKLPGKEYNSGARTARDFVPWITSNAASRVKVLSSLTDLSTWTESNEEKPRVVLLSSKGKIPLLWKVLSVRYSDRIYFASMRNPEGHVARVLRLETTDDTNNKLVAVYGPKAVMPVRYQGKTKMAAFTKYFDAVLDGTAGLPTPASVPAPTYETSQAVFEPEPETELTWESTSEPEPVSQTDPVTEAADPVQTPADGATEESCVGSSECGSQGDPAPEHESPGDARPTDEL